MVNTEGLQHYSYFLEGGKLHRCEKLFPATHAAKTLPEPLTTTEIFGGGTEHSCELRGMQYWTRGTTQDDEEPNYPSIKDYPLLSLVTIAFIILRLGLGYYRPSYFPIFIVAWAPLVSERHVMIPI